MPTGEMHVVKALGVPGSPSGSTILLPLSAGLSVVSLPLRVPSEKLSDIFPNLPPGSRVWAWDGIHQKFVEGLENELPLGHACWLYVPVPVLLTVTGSPNRLQQVSFDLEQGWNLIGVPYGTALLRSQQQVYVNWARKPFNDAVTANEIDPLIYTFDVNGYETVGEGDSFQPLRGYWVYAEGAELLELANPTLSDGGGFSWTSLISPLAGFAVNSLLTQMGLTDTSKLIQITGKLDQIQNSLNALSAQLTAVQNALSVAETNIIQQIGWSTLVAPVQTALKTHYDDVTNPNASLNDFLKKAKDNTPVSTDAKSTFAKNVVTSAGGYGFIDLFNSINTAILPATGDPGMIDNFANRIVLTSNESTLMSNYVAMETYYSTLVAMQVKCATLILTAYDQLGSDPAYSALYPAPKTATDWKNNVFNPAIKAETEAFLRAAENVVVKKLPIPTASSDPPVKMPDAVQAVIGRADAFVMGMLNPIYPNQEPPGFRVRVLVNPSADLPRLYWTGTDTGIHWKYIDLPPFDQWRTVHGDYEYDDWILDPALKPAAFKDIPAFNVTTAWRLTRIILPASSSTIIGGLAPGCGPFMPCSRFWADTPQATVAASTTDAGSFGSITFAARPSTRDVFNPCNKNYMPDSDSFVNLQYSTGSTECGGPSTASGFNPCGTLNFFHCAAGSRFTLGYVFGYAGTVLEPGAGGVPRDGTWKADGTYTSSQTYCSNGFGYELWEGDSKKNETADGAPPPITPQNYSFTWQPGKKYTFNVSFVGIPIFGTPACDASWQYKGANITFP